MLTLPMASETRLSLLIVEDSEADYRLLGEMLASANIVHGSFRVERASALRQAMRVRRWDAVISDLVLPGFYGLEALRIVRATDPDCPFLLFSGALGNWGPTAKRLGADAYLEKRQLAAFAPALLGAIARRKSRMSIDETACACV